VFKRIKNWIESRKTAEKERGWVFADNLLLSCDRSELGDTEDYLYDYTMFSNSPFDQGILARLREDSKESL